MGKTESRSPPGDHGGIPFSKLPDDARIVLAAETIFDDTSANVIDVSWKKDRILRRNAYPPKLLITFGSFLDQATLSTL